MSHRAVEGGCCGRQRGPGWPRHGPDCGYGRFLHTRVRASIHLMRAPLGGSPQAAWASSQPWGCNRRSQGKSQEKALVVWLLGRVVIRPTWMPAAGPRPFPQQAAPLPPCGLNTHSHVFLPGTRAPGSAPAFPPWVPGPPTSGGMGAYGPLVGLSFEPRPVWLKLGGAA